MCGLAGIMQKGVHINDAQKATFFKAIRHRGPDGEGFVGTEHAALFHTRLAIVDLSLEAAQPFTDGRSLYLVFNGEIYNHKELRRELEKEFSFRTQSDTEVLLNAYKKWGKACLGKFKGMFSFLLYNTHTGSFFAAVDRLGKKPFYYRYASGTFLFASELGALEALTDKPFQMSWAGIHQFLALGYTLAPDTIYQDVYSLAPGTCLTGSVGQPVQVESYFDLAEIFQRTNTDTYTVAQEKIRQLLQHAVTVRLDADVDVGVLLSGGMDSTLVAALASSDPRTKSTFTVGFENAAYNELAHAQKTALELGLLHEHVIFKNPGVAYISRYLQAMDHPLGDNSMLAFDRLAYLASGKVKVVLSGDGADEIFAGYPTLKADLLNERYYGFFKMLSRAGIFKNAHDGVGMRTKAARFLKGLDKDYRKAHYNWRLLFTPEQALQIAGNEHAEAIREHNPYTRFKQLYERVAHLDRPKQHLYVDMMTWLPNDILVKIDRAGMKHGVEVRSPFLDDDLVNYVCSLPTAYLLHTRKNKPLLADAYQNEWGRLFKNRRKKGFNVPVGEWALIKDDEFKFYISLVYHEWIAPKL